MENIVRCGGLSGFERLVRDLGRDPSALLRNNGFPVDYLHDPDRYISYQSLAELLNFAVRECRCPDFGFRLGARQDLSILGALAPYLCSQPSVGDSFALVQKNLTFHARGVYFLQRSTANQITIELAFSEALSASTNLDQSIALTVSNLVLLLDQLAGHRFAPLAIELAISDPGNRQKHDFGFSCPVHFDRPVNRVRFVPELFTLPVAVTDELQQFLSLHWRAADASSPSLQIDLRDQVKRAVLALLPTGECNLQEVAELVELSPRMLQKRLQKQGLRFSQILSQARMDVAKQHLRYSDINLTELTLNLGFEDPAVFSRAFKLWTGSSPRHWRQLSQAK